MNTEPESTDRLAEKIEASDKKLHALAEELAEIGEPATHDLQHRLDAIEVEEHALKRNFAEMRQSGTQDEDKARKVETLLHHIEAEEDALQHEADFLHQGSPSTLEFAYRIGSRVFDLGATGVKKIMGDHHLLWHSPFVNTTIEGLASRFHLPDGDVDIKHRKSR